MHDQRVGPEERGMIGDPLDDDDEGANGRSD